MERVQSVFQNFLDLPRNLKVLVGLATILMSCIACFYLVSLWPISDPATLESDQDSIVETARAELLDELAQTESVSSTKNPGPSQTSQNSVTPPPPAPTTTPISSGVHQCIPSSEYETALVESVIDGDTIRVILDGQSILVRYIGMDAPDAPNTGPAKVANIELVAAKTVLLYKDSSNTDPFDRLLRYVYVGDIFVNHDLVARGFASSDRFPPDTSCNNYFDQAQAAAVSAGLGMWQSTPSTGPQIEIIRVQKQEEYVDIRNNRSETQSIAGWQLVSERGNQICFLSGNIEAGATLRIWAMSGHLDGLNCGFGTNIWNNSQSDPAVLYDQNGIQIDRFPNQ